MCLQKPTSHYRYPQSSIKVKIQKARLWFFKLLLSNKDICTQLHVCDTTNTQLHFLKKKSRRLTRLKIFSTSSHFLPCNCLKNLKLWKSKMATEKKNFQKLGKPPMNTSPSRRSDKALFQQKRMQKSSWLGWHCRNYDLCLGLVV